MIYFIDDGENIKIGYTARTAESRLRDFQVGNSRELTVLAAVSGEMRDEKRLHRAFGMARVRGEWFRRGPVETAIVGASSTDDVLTNLAAARAAVEALAGMAETLSWNLSMRRPARSTISMVAIGRAARVAALTDALSATIDASSDNAFVADKGAREMASLGLYVDGQVRWAPGRGKRRIARAPSLGGDEAEFLRWLVSYAARSHVVAKSRLAEVA